jgi:hypothetical protein
MDELKLRLPTTLGNMIEPHKYQVEYVDLPGPNKPSWVSILFHLATFVFLKCPVRTRFSDRGSK